MILPGMEGRAVANDTEGVLVGGVAAKTPSSEDRLSRLDGADSIEPPMSPSEKRERVECGTR